MTNLSFLNNRIGCLLGVRRPKMVSSKKAKFLKMVSSKKAKQAGLSQRLKEDRISQLPDPLICQILSHLTPKDSVKTSVLSTRWKTLWLWVPSLKMIFRHFPDFSTFVSFGNRFFDTTNVSCLEKVELITKGSEEDLEDDAPYFASWIDAAVKRKVQHLDVFFPQDALLISNKKIQIPISIYICDTLVSLEFNAVVLPNAEFVSLPCLKTMRLLYVLYPNAATFERLVSCSPVLEYLNIEHGIEDSVMRVYSLSLKRLVITSIESNSYGVVIDAPLLGYLEIDDLVSESYIIKNMGSIAKVNIDLTFGLGVIDEARVSSRISSIRSFFLGISKVKEMEIYENSLKLICQYSKVEPFPQFSYMSRLHADIDEPNLKILLPLLGSCPNLKSLSVVWYYGAADGVEETLSYVPDCLVSSLKYVDIKRMVSGSDAEMKIVRYFLENSVNLEKLTLSLYYRENVNDIYKKLLEIPRRSITCRVIVL